MDLLSSSPTTNTPLTTVFGDNVQDLLGTGALNVNPTGIIVVNSIADTIDDPNSGVTTLRDAINQANGDSGQDLIVFDRASFSNQQTIILSGTELDITHNLDIIAPRDPLTGADLVTVSGNKASRVFEIEPGATVSEDGLIIADGLVTNDDGGGIKNSGTLTLDNSFVLNNSTGNLQSTATNMPTDSARNGGGIFNGNDANLTVSNSTISNNSVRSYDASLGGGIYNIGGIVTVSNSTFSGNNANLTVGNGTISNNSVKPLYVSLGGGIYNIDGIVTVSNSTLSGNSVFGISSGEASGGGIYNTDMGVLTVIDSTIENNSIDGLRNPSRGAGISNEDAIVTVSNSTLSNNSITGFDATGGGIYNHGGTVTVNNSILSGNFTKSGYLGIAGGGGIYSDGGTVTVNNSILSGNNATGGFVNQGGGIANFGTGIVTVNNSTISGNFAEDGLTDLSGNNATGGLFNQGGGIANFGTGIVTVNNSTISGNFAEDGLTALGGGIYNRGILTISNSTISGNIEGRTHRGLGGGIYNNGTVTVAFSTLTGNQADNGGGVYNDPGSVSFIMLPTGTVNVRNTIIAGNINSTEGVNPDVSGTFNSNGYNLIDDSTGSAGFDATGDIVGTSDNPIDPRLAPLDYNGGSTQTLALLSDSPAIGAGDPTVLDTDPTTDQRGLPRRALDGTTDIGAYEFSS